MQNTKYLVKHTNKKKEKMYIDPKLDLNHNSLNSYHNELDLNHNMTTDCGLNLGVRFYLVSQKTAWKNMEVE